MCARACVCVYVCVFTGWIGAGGQTPAGLQQNTADLPGAAGLSAVPPDAATAAADLARGESFRQPKPTLLAQRMGSVPFDDAAYRSVWWFGSLMEWKSKRIHLFFGNCLICLVTI